MNNSDIAPAVRLSGLDKSFGAVHAVRGVDLTVRPGEVVAFLGHNGAGKSTTIDMLLGLTTPDRGTVHLFGTDARAAVVGGRVGAMLQSGALLPDVTVRQLLTTFAALHRSPLSVGETLERAGITDIAATKTTALSGGQAQRVRFALALVPDPDLLVLDEPTVAMDVEIRRAFWASMREYSAAGRTVLFATHYLEEADDFADRVVVLAEGRVVADGTGASIKALVGHRTVTVTLDPRDTDGLDSLPGVTAVDRRGDTYLLRCTDSDLTIRALLAARADAREISITSANLEDAFLALTDPHRADAPTSPQTSRTDTPKNGALR
ncbi:ABC transporter ATP-binding protein [Nakamurella silvestris]|nr:ABC transporter ATP-binding protein [Nakamurella silvestris]